MNADDLPMIAKDITAAYQAGADCERRMIFDEVLSPIFAAWNMCESKWQPIPIVLLGTLVSARAKFK